MWLNINEEKLFFLDTHNPHSYGSLDIQEREKLESLRVMLYGNDRMNMSTTFMLSKILIEN